MQYNVKANTMLMQWYINSIIRVFLSHNLGWVYNQRWVEVPLNLSSLTFDMIQYNAMDRHAASIVHFNNTMQIKYMAKSYSDLSM